MAAREMQQRNVYGPGVRKHLAGNETQGVSVVGVLEMGTDREEGKGHS